MLTTTHLSSDSVEQCLVKPTPWPLWLALSLVTTFLVAFWVYLPSVPENGVLRNFKHPLSCAICFVFTSAATILIAQSYLFIRWENGLYGDNLSTAGQKVYRYAETRARGAFGSADRIESATVLHAIWNDLQRLLLYRWTYPQLASVMVLLLCVILFGLQTANRVDTLYPADALGVVVVGVVLASILFFPAITMSLLSRKGLARWYAWATQQASAELVDNIQPPVDSSISQHGGNHDSSTSPDSEDPFSTRTNEDESGFPNSGSTWAGDLDGSEQDFRSNKSWDDEPSESQAVDEIDEEYNPDHAGIDGEDLLDNPFTRKGF